MGYIIDVLPKPMSIRIVNVLIFLQMALSSFLIIVFLLFMWLPDTAFAGWMTFKDNVLGTAFSITSAEYGWNHFWRLSGNAAFTLIVLGVLLYTIKKCKFGVTVLLSVLLIGLTLSNPVGFILSIVILLLITTNKKARDHLKKVKVFQHS